LSSLLFAGQFTNSLTLVQRDSFKMRNTSSRSMAQRSI